jgi:hypothetical protein
VQDDLVRELWDVAKSNGWRVRQFSATPETPFASHVAAMAQTGILVARHGSTLASSFLLPSGAAVYELLPYNWEWKDLNQIYRNMTRSTGRLHHYAWRATDPKWAQYAETEDRSRYSHFRASECTSRYDTILCCSRFRHSLIASCLQDLVKFHLLMFFLTTLSWQLIYTGTGIERSRITDLFMRHRGCC